MQLAKVVKQYDLAFPVARVWAAFLKKKKKLKKEFVTKKEVQAMGVTFFQ